MTHSARRKAPQDQPSAPPDQPASESTAAALMVELVIQYPEAAAHEATSSEATSPEAANPEATNPEEAAQPVRYELVRTLHRVPPGTTIRQLLQVGQGADLIPGIEAKALGLSRFGRRAWLDDPLRPDDRVEVLCPILADAKAARFARVAKSRAERTDGRWGRAWLIVRSAPRSASPKDNLLSCRFADKNSNADSQEGTDIRRRPARPRLFRLHPP